MVTTVRSLGLTGISGYEVTVECMLSGGLPAFDVVGLPDTAVKEARERVRAAVKNCGAQFPVSRITVNLAPARVRKEGTVYDLPILLGIMAAAGEIRALPEDAAFLGELSLTGQVRPVTGVLPMALTAAASGVQALYVPAENAAEAAEACGDTMLVYPAHTALEVVDALREKGFQPVEPAEQSTAAADSNPAQADDEDLRFLIIKVPRDGFTPETEENLRRIIASEASLLKKALETDSLEIVFTEDTLCF